MDDMRGDTSDLFDVLSSWGGLTPANRKMRPTPRAYLMGSTALDVLAPDSNDSSFEAAIEDRELIFKLIDAVGSGASRSAIHRGMAAQLRRLQELVEEDDDEDAAHSISPETLRVFVDFVSSNPLSTLPQLGVTGNGSLTAQWCSPHGLIASMHFLPRSIVNWAVHEAAGLNGRFGSATPRTVKVALLRAGVRDLI